MSNHVLVFSDFNYADEFDVRGFAIYTIDDWRSYLAELQEYFTQGSDPLEYYFGTNEAILVGSFQEIEQGYTVTPISEAEASLIDKLFPWHARGSFITFETGK